MISFSVFIEAFVTQVLEKYTSKLEVQEQLMIIAFIIKGKFLVTVEYSIY